MYACTYHLFAGMWRPLDIVITMLYYVVIILHCRVWYRVLSLRYVFEAGASSSCPTLALCQISFLPPPPLVS